MPNYPAVMPTNVRGALPQLPATIPPAGASPNQPGAAGGFQGFPNFNVPFPYANLPQQLQASMQMPQGQQQYGRFAGQLPPQANGQLPPMPPNLPQLPQQAQPQGAMNASNLPTGPGGGMPGFAPSSSQSYQQMKADTLRQLTAGQRQRAAANTGPSLAEFQQTFNSLPEADRFVYWNNLPHNGSGEIDKYLSSVPGFRSWVNNMYNNYNGGSLAGARAPQGLLGS
jgi:hypothetical protein